MEKRFILFILIAAAILYFSNSFLIQKYKPKHEKTNQNVSENTEIAKNDLEKAQNNNIVAKVEEKAVSIERIENQNIEIEATSLGAKIEHVFVKKIEGNKAISEKIDLIDKTQSNNHLSCMLSIDGKKLDLNSINWNVQRTENSLVFRVEPIKNIIIQKTVTISGNYDGKIELYLENKTDSKINVENISFSWGPDKGSGASQYDTKKITVLSEKKLERFKAKKHNEEINIPMQKGWVGLSNQYFCSIFYGNPGDIRNTNIIRREDQSLEFIFEIPSMSIDSKSADKKEILCYFGPQNYRILIKKGYFLNKMVDFGFFKVISIPLYYLLNYFYKLTNNYGVSIILLTLLIRLILWWPTQKSYSSMKKMQTAMNKMQPRLKTLKEIYRDNPAKLNEETMKLYKEYQVNPMGGCLPMLLQMPVFFALYATLISSVELKGAKFIWFWTDLSTKDPHYVLPILMGITMFLQQKMSSPPAATPEAAAQQKMMLYFMPIMLTFFAFMWPSGLLLYWVVSNILSIGQQLMINRKDM